MRSQGGLDERQSAVRCRPLSVVGLIDHRPAEALYIIDSHNSLKCNLFRPPLSRA